MIGSNRILRAPLTLALAMVGLGAAGDAAAICSLYPKEFQAITAVRIVGNAAEIGEALTPWIASETHGVAACGPGSWTEHFLYEGTSSEIGIYTEGGVTYGVYSTPMAGIGVVVRLHPHTAGEPSGWPGGLRTGHTHWVNGRTGYGDDVYLDQRLSIRFIKLAATVPGDKNFSAWRLLKMHRVTTSSGRVAQTEEHTLGSFSVTVEHRPLCHVQSKTVNMGIAFFADFEKVGDGTPPVDYSVEMECEVDAGRANYYLEPISPVVDKEKGIISTTGGAVGFGLQLLSESGSVVEIGKAYPFGNSAADGRRTAAFKARYIRTESDGSLLETGRADAQVRYRVDYP
ncbi:fimbrial protein [Stenotrophomonas maltophilia]|uniref:fimbrial protein n=1 Tax=Stenotrophomonas maltophilia TaxID=40324 RepID=UPI0002C52898|nr:fimbrial protein [Stenotrophomonas maltophilia]MBA0397436.1 fimbrial protein [Stenotrophomonas maltophilia]QGL76381.1 fimbrial protein [Stenotrophomonas maltophilia]CCP16747.1 hypothetical protein predicted by Glimmer/Critica [Stenotrophomonas maltophilia RA8]